MSSFASSIAQAGDATDDEILAGARSGLITPPCGVLAVRGMMLPSSICTGAFSQRSM
jgi:hypothetical protein